MTDVFAESRYSGNQLATFLDASRFSDEEMGKIAFEIHFSETSFIYPDPEKNGGYRVRIFTPGGEVDFAGHPTLGTAAVIRKYLIHAPTGQVLLNLNVGPVPVRWVKQDDGTELPFMRQVKPKFGKSTDRNEMAGVLNLDPDDLDDRWPIEIVSTGLPHFIVPLKSMDALKRVSVHLENYGRLTGKAEAKVILVFCQGGYSKDQALGVRVFPIHYGIPEDPATGSGNGCLAAYLSKHRYLGSDSIRIRTGQGYEIGRPSQLFLVASEERDGIRVEIGGNVMFVAQGTWEP